MVENLPWADAKQRSTKASGRFLASWPSAPARRCTCLTTPISPAISEDDRQGARCRGPRVEAARQRAAPRARTLAAAEAPPVRTLRTDTSALLQQAGQRACVAPRPAFNIVLAGESGFRRICTATARRVLAVRAASLWEPTVAAARDAHPIHSAASAQSVLRPPPAVVHRDCRRHRMKPCSLAIRCGAIPFQTAAFQRINAPANTRSPRSPWFTRSSREATPATAQTGEVV